MNKRRRASDKKKLLILIVDDDITMRLLMRASLEKEGMIVEEAADGEAALTFLDKAMPDIILLDVQMPKMDGFTVCKKIRLLPNGIDVPILMVTGLDDTASIKHAYDAGATDFVIKPINWLILNYRLQYIARAGQASRALRDSELHLALAQKVARMGNWKWNIADDTVYCSKQMFAIFGKQHSEATLPYASFMKYVHESDKKIVSLAIEEALNEKKDFSMDHRLTTERGEIFVHNQAEVQFDASSKAAYMFGTMQDITVRKQLEQRTQYLAYYDELTGLANRQLFKEKFDLEIKHSQREKTLLALCYMDLDHFKKINDSLGHDAGDYVLKVVAKRLKMCLRSSDSVARLTKKISDAAPLHEKATLSRMGGDEFTLLLPGLNKPEQAALVARRIIKEIEKPITISGTDYYVTASIGIALCPEDGTDMDALLKSADVAMYSSKRDGKNGYTFYSKNLNKRAVERFSMQNELRQALENSQLLLHYQPVAEANTGRIKGFEALIRWQHPSLGLLLPDKFIRLAEESGQINAIGEWVLNTACTRIIEWQQYHATEALFVSVNFSAVQLKQKNMLTMMGRVLKETGLPPHLLDIELTESVIMNDTEQTIKVLHDLKNLGINLSIDNFGTGYSSLSYLKKLPIDVIKIDRSFITGVEDNGDDAAIVRAVVGLAKTMGMSVVAEGVEHDDQLELIRSIGCDDVQGFLLGRPMPAEEVVPFLEKKG